jgi:flagellin FlaB
MGKVMKSLKRFLRNKKAISGLETAIVLIAFVIVASAFAYAVLNMGFLVIQKSEQVVLGGLAAASSALVVDGPVYGYSTAPGPNGNMTTLIFWLKTASGASSVDLNVNKTTVGFQNPRGVWPNVYNTGGNTLAFTVADATFYVGANATSMTWEVGSGYQILPGEKVRVTIDLTQLTMTGKGNTPAGEIMKNEEFKVIIKPPVGSVLDINRVTPAAVTQVNDLG